MEQKICPFAKKVDKRRYLCVVTGDVSLDFLGLHTKRWRRCPTYYKGINVLASFQTCLLNAARLGAEVLEKVIESFERGMAVPSDCNPNSCERCPCYYKGKCLLGIK